MNLLQFCGYGCEDYFLSKPCFSNFLGYALLDHLEVWSSFFLHSFMIGAIQSLLLVLVWVC